MGTYPHEIKEAAGPLISNKFVSINKTRGPWALGIRTVEIPFVQQRNPFRSSVIYYN